MKICVYAIGLNEEKYVEQFYQSAQAADLILLADTGSTDCTTELAESLGIEVHKIKITPWRFDHARNAALALIPEDYDCCISLDLDECLVPGWRSKIENAWDARTTRLQYRYDWGKGHIFTATKIHHRKGYFWQHMCHEMIMPDPRTQEAWAEITDVLITHHPDPNKSRSSYLALLEAAVQENPTNSRDRFYLAREYWYAQDYSMSIKEFKTYLSLPTSTWYHERCFALRTMGKCLMQLGHEEQALVVLRSAVDQARGIREPWHDLAQACYELKQWSECYFASTSALAITQREYAYTSDEVVWSSRLYDLAAISAYHLGLFDQAKILGQQALELEPLNQRLRSNLEYYNKA